MALWLIAPFLDFLYSLLVSSDGVSRVFSFLFFVGRRPIQWEDVALPPKLFVKISILQWPNTHGRMEIPHRSSSTQERMQVTVRTRNALSCHSFHPESAEVYPYGSIRGRKQKQRDTGKTTDYAAHLLLLLPATLPKHVNLMTPPISSF